MGVADMDRLPWIADEIAYLADAVDRDIPVWGVCLGAQLLAAALGAKVYTGDAPEVGVGKVALTAAGSLDAVWGSMGPELSVVQWHSDTFELPEGAVHLASSDKYAHQLFRYGRSYGVQFHLEAPADLVAEWADIPEYRASLTEALGAEGVAILAQTMNEVADQIHENATDAIRGWSRLWS
ncbi:hypothetical protein MKANGN_57090 [Mycobacterium kansasii]|nr:hypothetical protein MKANGN_57090 [Mycobacterium kansasii]